MRFWAPFLDVVSDRISGEGVGTCRNGGHAVGILMPILDEILSVLWRYGMAVDVYSLHLIGV